jgi:hypothetical protein
MNCIDSVRTRWLLLLVSSLGAAASAAAAGISQAVPSCDAVKAGKGEFIEIVNADLVPVRGPALDIGEIDFAKTRSIHNAWFVVSSPKITLQTGLGGEEFRAILEPAGRICAKAKVAPLSLEFDGSSLGPGRFEQPLSIFREDSGRPPLEAAVQKVTGTVKRVWMDAKAEALSSDASIYRVHLINSGNIPSGAIHLMVFETPAISIRTNECDGRGLAPADSCDIDVALHADKIRSAGLEEHEVPISMEGVPIVENTLWLNVRNKKLRVFTTNR